MKGYIYSMYRGADPSKGWVMNDPIFGTPTTLGSCVPNLRRNVEIGDWVFVVSGLTKAAQQYVVGGFQVDEKINQLAALARFPELAVKLDPQGHITGNIIVNADGSQRIDDNHTNFQRRLENYLIGGEWIEVRGETQIEHARAETLRILSDIFKKDGNRPFDIIGRMRRMESDQVNQLHSWLTDIQVSQP